MPLSLRAATLADLPTLQRMRSAAAAWIGRTGSDQWQRPWPDAPAADARVTEDIAAGRVLLVQDQRGTAGTVTVSLSGPAALWTAGESAEPALYVSRLTVRDRGTGLGAELLDWVGGWAFLTGRRWVRLDAWTTNSRLHAWYQEQGFHPVRVAVPADGRPSAALFARAACWRPMRRLPAPPAGLRLPRA